MKIGSIVFGYGAEGTGFYVVTDMPEHDRTVVRIAKNNIDAPGKWVQARSLDVMVA